MNKKNYFVMHLIAVPAALFLFCFLGLLGERVFSEKVCADVIFEPTGDFYQEHRDNCQVEDRTYIVKEPGASVFKEPGGIKAGYYEGGTIIHSDAIYFGADGKGAGSRPGVDVPGKWISFYSSDGEYWIQWEDCELKYDNISFMEEHGDELIKKSEEIDSDKVVFYTYPQSDEIAGYIRGSEDFGGTEKVFVDRQYTDPEGKRWGYVSYYYGYRDVWVCLDDPSYGEEKTELNEDSETAHPDQEKMEQEAEDEDSVEAGKNHQDSENAGGDQNKNKEGGIKYAVLIALAAVIAGTIGILEYYRRKRGGTQMQ